MLRFQAHRLRVREVAFSPDGRLLLTRGATDPRPALWDACTGQLLRRVPPVYSSGREPTCLGFSPDGRLAACGLNGGAAVAVLDIATGDRRSRLRTNSSTIRSFAIDPIRGWVVTSNDYGRLDAWTEPHRQAGGERDLLPDKQLRMPSGEYGDLAFAPDGKYVAIVASKSIELWTVEPWGWYATIHRPESVDEKFIRYGRCGTRLVVGTTSKVEVWRVGDDPPDRLCQVHQRQHGYGVAIRAADLSADGRTLLTAGTDGHARLWDAGTGAAVAAFDWGVGKLFAAAASPDGTRWAVGGDAGTVVVWDA